MHPKVEKTIRRDLRLMSIFAHALTLIPGVQWLSLPEEVEVFGKMMYEQLDLRIEGRNLSEFSKRFTGRKLPVTFPRPLEMWSTRDVLVEEYQNALSLEDFLRNGGGPYNDTLAEVGLDAFLVRRNCAWTNATFRLRPRIAEHALVRQLRTLGPASREHHD